MIATLFKGYEFIAGHEFQGHQIQQCGGDFAIQLNVAVGKLSRHDLGQVLAVDQALFQAELADHLLGDVLLGEDVLKIILGHEAQLEGPVSEAKLFVSLGCHISLGSVALNDQFRRCMAPFVIAAYI